MGEVKKFPTGRLRLGHGDLLSDQVWLQGWIKTMGTIRFTVWQEKRDAWRWAWRDTKTGERFIDPVVYDDIDDARRAANEHYVGRFVAG